MLAELSARSDLRGNRIDVRWRWSGTGARPAFRLLRQRRAFPPHPREGLAVVDFSDFFRDEGEPWVRVDRLRFLVENSTAEGGLLQAQVQLFHSDDGEGDPDAGELERVELSIWDPAAEGMVDEGLDEVSRVEVTLPDPGDWSSVEELEIIRTPGGGAEESAGVVRLSRGHSDGVTPDRLRWSPTGGPVRDVDFDVAAASRTRVEVETSTERELHAEWPSLELQEGWNLASALSSPWGGGATSTRELSRLTLRERFSEDSGDWTRIVELADLTPVPEEVSYYTLFRRDPLDPEAWHSDREWRVHATATREYGFEDRVYGLLPSAYAYHDEPTHDLRGEGQLRRFMQVFGTSLDHLRSGVEALGSRHDVEKVRGDFLPALAGWIGWPSDRTASLPAQRSEVRFAPEVYRTVGTLPNIQALASRATGWRCEAKEFVHNIFLTNAPENVPVRALREMVHDGTDFGNPIEWTRTQAFDGSPCALRDGAGRSWLFWQSNRSGRWELWMQVDDGTETVAPSPIDELPPDVPRPTYSDLSPAAILVEAGGEEAIWLFWESNREGAWDIWGRVHDGADWGDPFRVTDHRASDRRPSVAHTEDGHLRLFWESDRRGPTEIWNRVHDGSGWGPAIRVTECRIRDGAASACLGADDRLRLVWRRDEGDRSLLYHSVLHGEEWGAPELLGDGDHRDGSPTLVLRGTELWLLWHSDRTGRWELWGRIDDGSGWAEPFQVTVGAFHDKDPFAFVDGADLRVFWRFEKPAPEHLSRTVDTSDPDLLRRMGRFRDRIHYTYDTRRGDDNWYARDTVGLYLTPPDDEPTDEARFREVIARARGYVDPFRPASVRLVWIPVKDEPELEDGFEDEMIDGLAPGDGIEDEFEDEIE